MLCTYQQPSWGVDPWTYGGIVLDLLTFVVNILPRDGATGMLLHFSM